MVELSGPLQHLNRLVQAPHRVLIAVYGFIPRNFLRMLHVKRGPIGGPNNSL
jgi:hypothetical protein